MSKDGKRCRDAGSDQFIPVEIVSSIDPGPATVELVTHILGYYKGISVVDLISDKATVELISRTPGSLPS